MTSLTCFAPHQALAEDLISVVHSIPGDTAHDLSHLLRVWQNVRRISANEGGNARILTAATLLHDSVALPKDAPDRAMASLKSAEFAEDLLTQRSWSAEDRKAVAHAIHAHSFSANVTPLTLEARILQDADRLDALGHIGIARCFAVSGALGRALYDPADPQARHRPLDDTAFAIDHFQTKLLHLSGGFQTATGRRLARERHAVLADFLSGFLAEVDGE